MANVVLADINEKIEAQIKSITGIFCSKITTNCITNFFTLVEKIIDAQYDLKDLTIFDNNPTQCKISDSDKLHALARDNAQLIFNQLFDRKILERTGQFLNS